MIYFGRPKQWRPRSSFKKSRGNSKRNNDDTGLCRAADGISVYEAHRAAVNYRGYKASHYYGNCPVYDLLFHAALWTCNLHAEISYIQLMCGRFTRMYTWEQLVRLYRLTVPNVPSNLQPRYNICPTTQIDVVVGNAGQRALEPMRWGLVPAWWKKPLNEMKMATFNARSETVTEKPMFRSAFKNRCVIPASGYYEWKAIDGQKQPFYFTAKQEPIVSIAGIWDTWSNPEDGKSLRSCTMLITGPNMFVQDYHDRMPVLLRPDQIDRWLSGESGKEVLVPAREETLQAWPVSRRVNSSRADVNDHTLIAEIKLPS